MSNKTFMMIKPDAVERGLIGDILNDITDAGFKIIALKLTQLSINEAQTFYSVHKERPFFNELTIPNKRCKAFFLTGGMGEKVICVICNLKPSFTFFL